MLTLWDGRAGPCPAPSGQRGSGGWRPGSSSSPRPAWVYSSSAPTVSCLCITQQTSDGTARVAPGAETGAHDAFFFLLDGFSDCT